MIKDRYNDKEAVLVIKEPIGDDFIAVSRALSSSKTQNSDEIGINDRNISMLVGSSSSISSGSSVSVPPESIRPAEGLVEIRRGYGASLDDRHFVPGGSITAILNFKEFARVCFQEETYRLSLFGAIRDCLGKPLIGDVILDFMNLLTHLSITEYVSKSIKRLKMELRPNNKGKIFVNEYVCKYFY